MSAVDRILMIVAAWSSSCCRCSLKHWISGSIYRLERIASVFDCPHGEKQRARGFVR